MEPSEALEVAKTVYRTYGYSYAHDYIYYPEKIIALNASGEVQSAVAVTEADEIAAREATETARILQGLVERQRSLEVRIPAGVDSGDDAHVFGGAHGLDDFATHLARGTGYQYIARGQELPDAFSPSNQLWIEMAGEFQTMTEIAPVTVENVAGIVMKDETAEELRATYGELTPENLVDAVIAGDLVMGYTDPFASSTGLNFLLTVLDSIADGDESQLTSPDVASVFEQFQRQVPFVALTTLQMRDSVENDTGTLDTFVMEWQAFTNTDSLAGSAITVGAPLSTSTAFRRRAHFEATSKRCACSSAGSSPVRARNSPAWGVRTS